MKKTQKIMETKTNTSVIIPFFNNRLTLHTCIQSLLQCKPSPDQIICIDDGSTDGSAETIRELPVEIIQTGHVGRAAALNIGIRQAKGDLILFTDSDCIVPTDWVARYKKLFAEKDLAGIGGNLWPSRFSVVETAKVLRYVHEFDHDHLLEGGYTQFCLNGNNMGIRKQALDEIGGFDENYHHGADADLSRRLLASGFRLLRTRKITTTHLKVDSLASFLRTSFHRGSTIRFDSGNTMGGPALFLHACFSSLKNFVKDIAAVPKLSVFGLSGSMPAKGTLAALVNLLAAFWNGAGRWYYAEQFRKGGVS
jgi:GT2 family glycosyltransferase